MISLWRIRRRSGSCVIGGEFVRGDKGLLFVLTDDGCRFVMQSGLMCKLQRRS